MTITLTTYIIVSAVLAALMTIVLDASRESNATPSIRLSKEFLMYWYIVSFWFGAFTLIWNYFVG